MNIKEYDFRFKNLEDLPLINEIEKFKLIIDNNNISTFETISENCREISITYNKYKTIIIEYHISPKKLNQIILNCSTYRLTD